MIAQRPAIKFPNLTLSDDNRPNGEVLLLWVEPLDLGAGARANGQWMCGNPANDGTFHSGC